MPSESKPEQSLLLGLGVLSAETPCVLKHSSGSCWELGNADVGPAVLPCFLQTCCPLQIANHRYIRVTDPLCQALHFGDIFVFILESQLLSHLFSPRKL